MSIEVDPRTASPERLQHLATLGFNRLSFGVQDFDPDVQLAVHRVQPYEQVLALMAAAREIGFESINADLIYGLPKQTPESFARTVNQIAGLRPDRIALYAPDAEYWVPYAWEQQSPKDHVSLFYETVALLRMRVDRLEFKNTGFTDQAVKVVPDERR